MFPVETLPSERATVHRYAHRASYGRATIDTILDEGFVCHVGLQTDAGYPVVIPLAYGRNVDMVYLHGSAASRLFRSARAEAMEICMTVTLVDGLVVARSTYNTDINYRSVVLIGDATEVKDLDEKRLGLEALVNHIVPGRTADARGPTEKELRSTMLLSLPIVDASAKVRAACITGAAFAGSARMRMRSATSTRSHAASTAGSRHCFELIRAQNKVANRVHADAELGGRCFNRRDLHHFVFDDISQRLRQLLQ